jgi:hypothetical protein
LKSHNKATDCILKSYSKFCLLTFENMVWMNGL